MSYIFLFATTRLIDFEKTTVSFVLLAALLAVIMFYVNKSSIRGLKKPFWITIGVGTCVFMWGYWSPKNNNIGELLIRSFISSLEMFISETHLDEIAIEKEGFLDKSSGEWYLVAFFAVYSVALVLSFWAILEIFGSSIRGRIWAFFHKGTNKEHYIFWGINMQSFLVAKSLLNENKKDKEIIFINIPDGREYEKKVSFGSFFHTVFSDSNYMDRVYKELDRNVAVFTAKMPLGTDNGKTLTSQLSLMGLKWLKSRLLSEKTVIFFLDNNESVNIKNLHTLIDKGCVSPRIYCHAHRVGIIDKLSDIPLFAKVCFVDSSFLSIRELLKDKDGIYHPVKYVDIARDKEGRKLGYVNGEFNAMVLGFGETGQEAVKFLYEYGSFVGKNKKQIPSNIFVVDKNMDLLGTGFMSRHPGASIKERIHLVKADLYSSDFYDLFESIIDRVNYVVVSLGDDNLNLSVGFEILDKVYRFRNGKIDRFVLLIQQSGLEGTNISEKIRDVYKNNKYGDHVGYLGQADKIWSYRIISDEEINEMAKKYMAAYTQACGDPVYVKVEEGSDETIHVWDQRQKRLKKAIIKADLYDIEGFKVKEEQDRHNCIHARTKIDLGGDNGLNPDNIVSKYPIEKCHFRKSNDVIDKKQYAFEKQLAEYLAIGEHLRWNSSYEMMGYTVSPEGVDRDYLLKWHNCLRPYDELDEETKHYDWITVKTTYEIERSER